MKSLVRNSGVINGWHRFNPKPSIIIPSNKLASIISPLPDPGSIIILSDPDQDPGDPKIPIAKYLQPKIIIKNIVASMVIPKPGLN